MSWLHRLIFHLAWPNYEQECSGTRHHHRPRLRKLWSIIAARGGYYDPARRV